MFVLAYTVSICTWTKGRLCHPAEPEERLWIWGTGVLDKALPCQPIHIHPGLPGIITHHLLSWHLDLPPPECHSISSHSRHLLYPVLSSEDTSCCHSHFFIRLSLYHTFPLFDLIIINFFCSYSLMYISFTTWSEVSSFTLLAIMLFLLLPLSIHDHFPSLNCSTENDCGEEVVHKTPWCNLQKSAWLSDCWVRFQFCTIFECINIVLYQWCFYQSVTIR